MSVLLHRPDGSIHPAKAGAWVGLAVAMVGAYEGFAPKPYVDKIGTGQPITWCYGETKADGRPVPPFSKVFTKEECQSDLGKDLLKYDAMVHSCVKVTLPPHREAALVSFVYNLGQGPLCRSSIARNLNAGNIPAACNAILAYDHARGVRVAGLTRRRQMERADCLRED
jgi:lysozyme